MPAERYYYPESFSEGNCVTLSVREAHHLVKVMRGQQGERVELVNGKGVLATAEVVRIERQRVELKIEQLHQESESTTQVTLFQAMPRPNRLDTLVEKCTELGVDQIVLFPGERSERKQMGEKQLERLRGVAVAAMKQSGRLFLPQLQVAEPIAKWATFSNPTYVGVFDEQAPHLATCAVADRACAVVIGPESGLSSTEQQRLLQLGAKGVTLHHNILRTDTAAIVAIAFLSASSNGG